MRKLVYALLALTSCGSSSGPLAGTYNQTATLQSDGCGGAAQTETGTLSVSGGDGSYSITANGNTFTPAQNGNTLTWSGSNPVTVQNCSGTATAVIACDFGALTGTLNESVSVKCADGSGGTCNVVYGVQLTRE